MKKESKNNCKDSQNSKEEINKDSMHKNSSNSKTTGNSAENEIDYEALIAQVNQLNLSFDTLLVILTAILLNIYYVYYTRTQVLDTINNTKCAELLIDGTKIPRISNAMFLYATAIFLEINYSNYEKLDSVQGEQRDIKAINTAYRAFFSTLLVLIATAMSRSNLEV
ncbi:hypothetical protein H8S20_17105 [Clostridium sp. NSJ-6]|uniref:DUF4234 domain-containing protein n=1 Tax=Clostridium hominis TaxID=2763036 RepID=A0ABR7DIU6_9CLOT|nr:hypothetical protein [Clostridium hominis]MBC5630578.1 hypothetical protein [Clostridium hominis]MDU2672136.1 hypothetical protein [Clostridium sp.]